jgi:hypothetical protein
MKNATQWLDEIKQSMRPLEAIIKEIQDDALETAAEIARDNWSGDDKWSAKNAILDRRSRRDA